MENIFSARLHASYDAIETTFTDMCAFVYHHLCFEPTNQAVCDFPLCRLLWRESTNVPYSCRNI